MNISLFLYQEKQLEILDAYGREKIRPAKEAVRQSYEEYRKYMRALKELDTDEEQRNREKAFLEFEISEIEKAHLVPGEDEELETLYRRLNNGKLILETLQSVHSLTGYDSGQGAGEAVGTGVRGAFKGDRVRYAAGIYGRDSSGDRRASQ